jgi:hypothetical protein
MNDLTLAYSTLDRKLAQSLAQSGCSLCIYESFQLADMHDGSTTKRMPPSVSGKSDTHILPS